VQTRATFTPAMLLYPCNIVGIIRLGLIGSALGVLLVWGGLPETFGLRASFVALLGICALLDILDGHLARKLNQATLFGSRFDQIIDLLMHTLLWATSGFILTIPLLALEWTAGLAVLRASTRKEQHWKSALNRSGNRFARRYFANNQRNAISIAANVSHFIFPAALILGQTFFWAVYLSVPGVICYEAVTVIIISSFARKPLV
jgi:phosphatidylglycerophosphate synthase